MLLFVRRRADESWREAVHRRASLWGLERECLEIFDRLVASGTGEKHAAFDALYEWDLAEVES